MPLARVVSTSVSVCSLSVSLCSLMAALIVPAVGAWAQHTNTVPSNYRGGDLNAFCISNQDGKKA